jgi:hypothetical protein
MWLEKHRSGPERGEDSMSRSYTLGAVALIAAAWIASPRTVLAGAFYIQGSRCWCEGYTYPQAWTTFPVWFVVDDQSECDDSVSLVGAAFRIEGLPSEPAVMRRFDPEANLDMTGDAFGDGVVFHNLDALPAETIVGYISVYATTSLGDQVWSIEAHRGVEGATTPVAEFADARGTWIPQPGHSLAIGSNPALCETCVAPVFHDCPFAVEATGWSTVKLLYK